MNFGWYLEQFTFKGKPVAGGTVEFFVAGSTTTPKNIYYDVDNTILAPNPITLDSSGTMPQIYPEAGQYLLVLRAADGSLLYTRDRVSGSGGSGESGSGMVAIQSGDTLGYLADKVKGSTYLHATIQTGPSGNYLSLANDPVVSVTGSDAPGYLLNKVSALNTPISFESKNDKLNLKFDYSKIVENLVSTPYTVLYTDSNGFVTTSSDLKFDDPDKLGRLYTPNIQVSEYLMIGGGDSIYDKEHIMMGSTGGAQLILTPGVYDTNYVTASNSSHTAGIYADKLGAYNLSDGKLLIGVKGDSDKVYITSSSISYDASTGTLSTPALQLTSSASAGVLVSDASGNVSVTTNDLSDNKVKLNSTDTMAGYLASKLGAGTNIGFSVTTDSHGDKLWISARSNMLLNPTYVTANYSIVDTDTVVVSTTNSNVTITLPTAGSTYNGRGLYIHNNGTGVVTVAGTKVGMTGTIATYSKLQYRCLQLSDSSWAWVGGY